jgi:hypothetical protein
MVYILSRIILFSSSRDELILEAIGSSRNASGSKIYTRSLISFRERLSFAYEGDLYSKLNRIFVNDRNRPVLSKLVLIESAIFTRYEFPLFSPTLR